MKINHLALVCNRPGELVCMAALSSEANCVTDVVLSILHQRTTFSLAKYMFIFKKAEYFHFMKAVGLLKWGNLLHNTGALYSQ